MAFVKQRRGEGAWLPPYAWLLSSHLRWMRRMRLCGVRSPLIHLQHALHDLRHLWRRRLLRRLLRRLRLLWHQLLRFPMRLRLRQLRLRILRRRLEPFPLAVLTQKRGGICLLRLSEECASLTHRIKDYLDENLHLHRRGLNGGSLVR